MSRSKKDWKRNAVGAIAMFIFLASAAAVIFGHATFSEAGSLVTTVSLPLIYLAMRVSADSKPEKDNADFRV